MDCIGIQFFIRYKKYNVACPIISDDTSKGCNRSCLGGNCSIRRKWIQPLNDTIFDANSFLFYKHFIPVDKAILSIVVLLVGPPYPRVF